MKGQRSSMKHNACGKEWWGNRPYAHYPISTKPGTNKYFKRQVHKIERREGVKEVERQIIINISDIEPEIQEVVNKNFWDLI